MAAGVYVLDLRLWRRDGDHRAAAGSRFSTRRRNCACRPPIAPRPAAPDETALEKIESPRPQEAPLDPRADRPAWPIGPWSPACGSASAASAPSPMSAPICRRSSRWKSPSARRRSRSSMSTASRWRGAATWPARCWRSRNCRLTCPRPSSPSKTAASTITTASTLTASRAPWSPISCIAASPKAARPLTQQLAKNLFLTQERTITRKLQEVLLAIWLERKFSKTQILELYLNRVYFGAGAYGIEQASLRYFGKSARHLSVAEAAMLAGLVKSPSRLAPTRNFDAAEKRAKIVLAAMAELKLHQPDDGKGRDGQAAAHRCAARQWRGQLCRRLGHGRAQRPARPCRRGPAWSRPRSTAPCRPTRKSPLPTCSRPGPPNTASTQGALVAMTPDGAVRALIGGRNYADSQFNRAVAAKRQPGSAFKPFVYLTALEHGLTPDSVRVDAPDQDQRLAAGKLQPRIFRPGDADQGAGAVAQYRVGAPDHGILADGGDPHRAPARHRVQARTQCLDRARHFGSLAARTGRRLCDIRQWRLRRHAACHRARQQYRRQGALCPQPATARPHRRGALCRHDEPDDGRDTDHRHRAQGGAAGLAGGRQDRHLQDFRDAWFIGYTAHLVTGVWLGNDDNSPTKNATGGGMPVDIWSRFMRDAHQGVPVANLPIERAAAAACSPACSAATTERRRRQPRPASRWRLRRRNARPPAPPASTAGCSIICSADELATKHGTTNDVATRWRVAFGSTARPARSPAP